MPSGQFTSYKLFATNHWCDVLLRGTVKIVSFTYNPPVCCIGVTHMYVYTGV